MVMVLLLELPRKLSERGDMARDLRTITARSPTTLHLPLHHDKFRNNNCTLQGTATDTLRTLPLLSDMSESLPPVVDDGRFPPMTQFRRV
jgi:hypothetical protein